LTDPSRSPAARPSIFPREQWRRNQVAVIVAAAMVFLGFNLVMPFLPFYVESLGITGRREVALWSGLILTVSPLIASIMGPIWGRLADRVGMKIMVQRVLFTIALHWGLMCFARNIWQVLALRVMLGLFSGFGTMSVALVTHACPKERVGRSVGMLQAVQILSTAVGPFFGGILAQAIGIRRTFGATFGLCLLAFFFVLVLYRNTRESVSGGQEAPLLVSPGGPVTAGARALVAPSPAAGWGADGPLPWRRILALPLFTPLLPLLFLVNCVDRSFSLVVPLTVASLLGGNGPVEATAGVVMSGGALAAAASAFVLGRLAGRVPSTTLLLWSLLIGGVVVTPMAFCASVPPFALWRVLVGLAVGGAATLAYTAAGDGIPDAARATAYGLLSSTAMLGGALGPILAGLLTSWDPAFPFLAGSVVYLLLALHVALLLRRPGWAPGLAAPSPEGRP
jgi:MFS transporter, DHA1 family, multidrug resistance protein